MYREHKKKKPNTNGRTTVKRKKIRETTITERGRGDPYFEKGLSQVYRGTVVDRQSKSRQLATARTMARKTYKIVRTSLPRM